jgi:hypothetical protein
MQASGTSLDEIVGMNIFLDRQVEARAVGQFQPERILIATDTAFAGAYR